ncbi:hypothetical protein HD553DRAFT_365820 [Filobasidium floriforme]|uniref:uncharacterized protein n=1 Tax=Filobasidium floriforme TaxID=5210 RepID=UPI001E8E10F8|nr:uncharacterized protein HD553DRAFT_365820 [Filobasidium floriforme]KAH8077704.1 hypothetical protein HD553DRAFT_365820 [Filobasidium floriforme]
MSAPNPPEDKVNTNPATPLKPDVSSRIAKLKGHVKPTAFNTPVRQGMLENEIVTKKAGYWNGLGDPPGEKVSKKDVKTGLVDKRMQSMKIHHVSLTIYGSLSRPSVSPISDRSVHDISAKPIGDNFIDLPPLPQPVNLLLRLMELSQQLFSNLRVYYRFGSYRFHQGGYDIPLMVIAFATPDTATEYDRYLEKSQIAVDGQEHPAHAIEQWAVLGDMSSAVPSGFRLGGRIEHVVGDTYMLDAVGHVVPYAWSVLATALGPPSPIIAGKSPESREATTIPENPLDTPASTVQHRGLTFLNSWQSAFEVPKCGDPRSKAQASISVLRKDGRSAASSQAMKRGDLSATEQATSDSPTQTASLSTTVPYFPEASGYVLTTNEPREN